jgi:hypothetical protein
MECWVLTAVKPAQYQMADFVDCCRLMLNNVLVSCVVMIKCRSSRASWLFRAFPESTKWKPGRWSISFLLSTTLGPMMDFTLFEKLFPCPRPCRFDASVVLGCTRNEIKNILKI